MFTKSGTEKQLNLFSSSGELEEYCKLLPGRQKMANIVTFLLRQKLQDISQEELYS